MKESIIIGRTPEEMKRLGDKGLAKIGFKYDAVLEDVLFDQQILMDIAKPHIIIISGKRGSGKSYTMGVIIEEIWSNIDIRDYVSCLIVDTMGIFHSLKEPNTNPYESKLLESIGEKPKGFPIEVLVPKGLEIMLKQEFGDYLKEKGYRLTYDRTFELGLGDISSDDWREIFHLDQNEPMGILLDRVIRRLRERLGKDYDFDEIIDQIKGMTGGGKTRTAAALINRFRAAESWHIFSREGLNVNDIIKGGKIVSLDLSYLSYITAEWNVRVLPVAIISRYIARKATVMARLGDASKSREELLKDSPLVWLFIDEGHQFLPSGFTTPATYPLLEWIRQGRHPGLTLVLATQMPRRLHSDAMSLCDIAISHRITAKMDLDALRNIMHTYASDVSSNVASLPLLKGAALVVDDNSETVHLFRVRPRLSRHAGEDACVFNLLKSKPT